MNPEGKKYPEMATSSTIQMNISSYMFLAQFLEEKNIFHKRLGFNLFSAKLVQAKRSNVSKNRPLLFFLNQLI